VAKIIPWIELPLIGFTSLALTFNAPILPYIIFLTALVIVSGAISRFIYDHQK